MLCRLLPSVSHRRAVLSSEPEANRPSMEAAALYTIALCPCSEHMQRPPISHSRKVWSCDAETTPAPGPNARPLRPHSGICQAS